MSKWTALFNNLPYKVRHIASMSGAELHITHLKVEKQRLKKRYIQSIKEINAHIKSLERWVEKEGK